MHQSEHEVWGWNTYHLHWYVHVPLTTLRLRTLKWFLQLVLASFPSPGPGIPTHIPLLLKFFQALFPPLSPKTLSLSSARRVVLIAWNAERGTLDFRHYLITVRPYGVSRRVRKVLEGATSKSSMLDLGREQDVADYVLRKKGEEGYETASTSAASEVDVDEVTVKLAGNYVGRNNRKGEKRAVRLDEIGPRMELRLVKIAEGVPGKEGGVIFHQFSTLFLCLCLLPSW